MQTWVVPNWTGLYSQWAGFPCDFGYKYCRTDDIMSHSQWAITKKMSAAISVNLTCTGESSSDMSSTSTSGTAGWMGM